MYSTQLCLSSLLARTRHFHDADQFLLCHVLLLLVPYSGEVVAFKAVTAGDTTAASRKYKKVAGKGLSSGSYTFWKESATGLGASATVGPTTSVQACLNACDSDFDCAAVAMTGVSSASMAAAPGSCSLIKGDTTIATFKRSVTKAVVTRLDLSAAL